MIFGKIAEKRKMSSLVMMSLVMMSLLIMGNTFTVQGAPCPKGKYITSKAQGNLGNKRGQDLSSPVIQDLARYGFSNIKPDGSLVERGGSAGKWHLVYVSFCAKSGNNGCEKNSSLEGTALPNGRAAYLGGVGKNAQNKLSGINPTVIYEGEKMMKNGDKMCYYSSMPKDVSGNHENLKVHFGISMTEFNSAQGWFGDEKLKSSEGKAVAEAALPFDPASVQSEQASSPAHKKAKPQLLNLGGEKKAQGVPLRESAKTPVSESQSKSLTQAEPALEKPMAKPIDCPKELSEAVLQSLAFKEQGDHMVRGDNPYYLLCKNCQAIKTAAKGNFFPEATGKLLNQAINNGNTMCKYKLLAPKTSLDAKEIDVTVSRKSLQSAIRHALKSGVDLQPKK